MATSKQQKEPPVTRKTDQPGNGSAFQELPDEEFFSPSRPREEPGFSPVTIAIYIVIGLLLVAGIGGSVVGFRSTPLWMAHTPVSKRSISTRTTFKAIHGNGWTLTFQMMLSPSVAYFKSHLSGKTPLKYQLFGTGSLDGSGSLRKRISRR